MLLDRVLACSPRRWSIATACWSTPPSASAGTPRRCWPRIPQLTLVGLDRDPEALRRSGERLAPFAARVHLVHAVYDELPAVLAELGLDARRRRAVRPRRLLDAARPGRARLLLLARRAAGHADGPEHRTDRRRRRQHLLGAASWPGCCREFGEERFALRIAQAIDRERERAPLNSTARLAELVRDAIPAATRRTGGHPAKRTFQALRIEVNGELDALRGALGVGARRAAGRRADRRAVLPLARGPAGQAAVRRPGDRPHPARAAGAAARTRARSCGC